MRTHHSTVFPTAFEYERTNNAVGTERDTRFPPGWWIIPSVLPSLLLVVWLAIKLI